MQQVDIYYSTTPICSHSGRYCRRIISELCSRLSQRIRGQENTEPLQDNFKQVFVNSIKLLSLEHIVVCYQDSEICPSSSKRKNDQFQCLQIFVSHSAVLKFV